MNNMHVVPWTSFDPSRLFPIERLPRSRLGARRSTRSTQPASFGGSESPVRRALSIKSTAIA